MVRLCTPYGWREVAHLGNHLLILSTRRVKARCLLSAGVQGFGSDAPGLRLWHCCGVSLTPRFLAPVPSLALIHVQDPSALLRSLQLNLCTSRLDSDPIHQPAAVSPDMASPISSSSSDANKRAAIKRNIDQMGIKYDQLPQWPVWAPLVLYSHNTWKFDIAAKLTDDVIAVRRPLTQDERDALAEHFAYAVKNLPYIRPLYTALGYTLYRRTAPRFGFPFWNPDPSQIKFFQGIPDTATATAKKMAHWNQTIWKIMRFSSWLIVANIAVGIPLGIWSVAGYNESFRNDPRLQQYRADLEALSGSVLDRKARPGSRPDRPVVLGNLPTEDQQAFPQQLPQHTQSTWTAAQDPRPKAAETPFEDFTYEFDDASPVAPRQQKFSQQRKTQQGSSWDRLRDQARVGTTTQGQQDENQTSAWGRRADNKVTSQSVKQGTAFNFSSEDEARAYAKGQAQQEFDEMLERERKGESNPRR